jgi:hypothetical protein
MGATIIPRREDTESDTRPCLYFFAAGLFVGGRGVYPSVEKESACKRLKVKEINGAPLEHDGEDEPTRD